MNKHKHTKRRERVSKPRFVSGEGWVFSGSGLRKHNKEIDRASKKFRKAHPKPVDLDKGEAAMFLRNADV